MNLLSLSLSRSLATAKTSRELNYLFFCILRSPPLERNQISHYNRRGAIAVRVTLPMGIPLRPRHISLTPRISSSCNSACCFVLRCVARREIAFSINPDLAVMSTRSTSIRRRRAGVAYSVPSSPNSHNALHRSQISKLRRRKEEGSVVGKNLESLRCFLRPFFLSLICSLGTERASATRTESLENTDHLFFSLTHSLSRPTKRKTTV